MSTQAGLPSPCISVCQLDAQGGRCIACTRSLEQIEAWMLFDDSERLQIWKQLARHLGLDLEATFATRVGADRARDLVRRHGLA